MSMPSGGTVEEQFTMQIMHLRRPRGGWHDRVRVTGEQVESYQRVAETVTLGAARRPCGRWNDRRISGRRSCDHE